MAVEREMTRSGPRHWRPTEWPLRAQLALVALLSALAMWLIVAGLAAAVDDFVPKPIDREKLGEVLHRWGWDPAERPVPGCRSNGSPLEAPRPADPVPLNLGHLRLFVGDEPPTLRHHLCLFVASSETLLEQLDSATTLRDRPAASGLAHKLKGVCGAVGAEQMTGLSIRMEQALAADAWSDADELRAELREAFARARAGAQAV
jgi:HPt (histidine-containing phosphotransfer) domain-containing protein